MTVWDVIDKTIGMVAIVCWKTVLDCPPFAETCEGCLYDADGGKCPTRSEYTELFRGPADEVPIKLSDRSVTRLLAINEGKGRKSRCFLQIGVKDDQA